MLPLFNPNETGPHIYWMARLAGLVCLLVGLGLLGLSALAGLDTMMRPSSKPLQLITGFVLVFFLGIFLTWLGYRLTLYRLNRYQSILPPFGWYLLAVGIAVIGGSALVSGIGKLNRDDLFGFFSLVCIVAMCFKAGRVTSIRGKAALRPPKSISS